MSDRPPIPYSFAPAYQTTQGPHSLNSSSMASCMCTSFVPLPFLISCSFLSSLLGRALLQCPVPSLTFVLLPHDDACSVSRGRKCVCSLPAFLSMSSFTKEAGKDVCLCVCVCLVGGSERKLGGNRMLSAGCIKKIKRMSQAPYVSTGLQSQHWGSKGRGIVGLRSSSTTWRNLVSKIKSNNVK